MGATRPNITGALAIESRAVGFAGHDETIMTAACETNADAFAPRRLRPDFKQRLRFAFILFSTLQSNAAHKPRAKALRFCESGARSART
jgi:hypothetical protein